MGYDYDYAFINSYCMQIMWNIPQTKSVAIETFITNHRPLCLELYDCIQSKQFYG